MNDQNSKCHTSDYPVNTKQKYIDFGGPPPKLCKHTVYGRSLRKPKLLKILLDEEFAGVCKM